MGFNRRRGAPARQLDVLRSIGMDCVALQEFVNHPTPDGGTLLEHWCDSLGMQGRYVACFTRGGREFGNAILTRFPIIDSAEHDMSAPGIGRPIAESKHTLDALRN